MQVHNGIAWSGMLEEQLQSLHGNLSDLREDISHFFNSKDMEEQTLQFNTLLRNNFMQKYL